MAVSATQTWIAAEVLTATDLNTEFNNVVDNGEDLGWPASQAKDMDGQNLTLDADGDTFLVGSTNDRVDFYLGGVKLFVFDGSTASAVNGLTFAGAPAASPTVAITAQGTSADINIDLVSKGTGSNQISGSTLSGTDESHWVISQQVYGG